MLHRFAYAVLISTFGVVQQTAAQEKAGQGEDIFVTANVQFTLCHELTHALISTFDIPVLGREEDAADQIATICFLHSTDENRRDPQAVEKLVAVADAWRLEWELDKESGGTAYWDEHPVDIQRYNNVLCVLYGSDPERLENLPDQLELPWQRAWSCEDHEYDRIVEAGRWLLDTFGIRDDRSADEKTGIVDIFYDESADGKQQARNALKATEVFERKANLMKSLFDLPQDIVIVATDCLGDATASWNHDRREIVFCYDLVERFMLLGTYRQCILGGHTELADRRPLEPEQIRRCLP